MAGARDQRRSDEKRLDKMLREGNWEETPESLDSETARIFSKWLATHSTGLCECWTTWLPVTGTSMKNSQHALVR